jgi:formylglycine-generating enzyme required for sulfatase activity
MESRDRDKFVNGRIGEQVESKEEDNYPEVERTITNSLEMEMVLIPAGEFVMGSPASEKDRCNDEGPVHNVALDAFYLSTTEVTQGHWEAVMGGNPSYFNGESNLPVEDVSWNDVQEFIRKLNEKEGTDKYRLPTEAEWEYACRAGSDKRYSFGDSERELGSYAWYWANAEKKTHPVAQKRPNKWGLYDMHGNVWEWVGDWYDENYYQNSLSSNPTGPSSGRYGVLRGGSWYYAAIYLRSAYRYRDRPDVRCSYIGFRCAKDAA